MKAFRKEVVGWMASVSLGEVKRGYITTDSLCDTPCDPRTVRCCVGCRKVRIIVESVED